MERNFLVGKLEVQWSYQVRKCMSRNRIEIVCHNDVLSVFVSTRNSGSFDNPYYLGLSIIGTKFFSWKIGSSVIIPSAKVYVKKLYRLLNVSLEHHMDVLSIFVSTRSSGSFDNPYYLDLSIIRTKFFSCIYHFKKKKNTPSQSYFFFRFFFLFLFPFK